MLIKAAIVVLCVLWLLVCLRFYTMISRANVWQRRLLAIAGGLGAGLIYVVGSMMAPLFAPHPADAPGSDAPQEVRIRMK